jgi:hypothetical protein
MLDARKALLLRRGNDLSVYNKTGGRIVIESG